MDTVEYYPAIKNEMMPFSAYMGEPRDYQHQVKSEKDKCQGDIIYT